MTQQAESSGWDVATKLEHSHGGVPCVATAEIRRLQAEIATLKSALRTALVQQGKPVAYLAWRDGKPCYAGDDAVCEDAVWPLDADDDRESMPVYTAASPEVIPVQPNIKNQIFTDISAPQPKGIEDALFRPSLLQHQGVGGVAVSNASHFDKLRSTLDKKTVHDKMANPSRK